MKAVVIESYGGKDQLVEKEVPAPVLGNKQVIIKSEATSINPIDWKLREGYLKNDMDWKFPIILGWDIAGVITETGSEVTDWHVGDKVFARPDTTRFGTYAEYVAVDDYLLAKKPENISYAAAASVPLAGLTAYQALFDHGKLEKGQTVLIQGGAGGVGTFAVQFAKAVGAKVITTASKKNHELLKKIGADETIDYHEENFAEKLSDIDLIFDTIGGDVQKESFKIAKKHTGRIVTIVGPADPDLSEKYDVALESIWLNPDGKQLQKIADWIEKRIVTPVIGASFPFSQQGLQDAHALSETHHAVGKIVITF